MPKYSLKTVAMLYKDMDGNAKLESRSYFCAEEYYMRVHDGYTSYIGCVTFFGYYIWLQSDAAFYYPRLDKCSFSVGMFVLRAMSHVGHLVA